MNNPKISVIVPIYNAEKYLKKCLNSITYQTYENLEIILVNDGSTDGSKDIIQEYAFKDSRIVVIQKENGGIGSAYEVAFKKMTGEYVSFVDSDDYIALVMYKELVRIIESEKPDIIQFNMIKVDEYGNEINIEQFRDITYNAMEQYFNDYYTKRLHPSLGCRIFKSNLLENAQLIKQNIGIDELLITQAIIKANNLVSINRSFYYLFARDFSVSRSKIREETLMQGIEVHRLICEIFDNNNSKLFFYPRWKYLDYIIFAFCDLELGNSSSIKRIAKILVPEFHENLHRLKGSIIWRELSFMRKTKFNLFSLNPNMYTKINKVYKKSRG